MIIGIDLGTSTSEVSVLRNGRPHLIREVMGSARGILPSVVGLNSRGRIAVGEDMVSQLLLKPDFTVQEVKRKMGSGERIQLGAESYTPQEISAFILRHLKEEAERYLGEPVTEAVVTVPAFFTDAQRRATEDAGEIAGLRVRRLIAEPTAAALAYGIDRPGVEEHVLVYDLGGGTLDVTLLELSEGVLDVLASTGNNRLGGKDFDERLMNHVAAHCRRAHGVELLSTPRLRQRLKAACKKAKEALSASDAAPLVLENIGTGKDGDPVDLEMDITREDFEELIRDLVVATRAQIDEALAHRHLTPSEVSTVLLVGGSTRIPLVRRVVSDYFSGRVLTSEVSPDEAVSLGAAVLGGILENTIDPGRLVVTDVTPFTLGVSVVEVIDGALVPGVFDPLIVKQSTIPRTVKKRYSTRHDWQEAVFVEVFQGDAAMCSENEPVTQFHHRMKPAPAGATVEIEFSYDLSGLVKISARDVQSGEETTVEVRPAKLLMSEEDKLSAREKVDRQWQGGIATAAMPSAPTPAQEARPIGGPPAEREAWRESPLYKRVGALIAHAEKERLRHSGTTADRIAKAIEQLLAAVQAQDAAATDRAEHVLTDVLFDIT